MDPRSTTPRSTTHSSAAAVRNGHRHLGSRRREQRRARGASQAGRPPRYQRHRDRSAGIDRRTKIALVGIAVALIAGVLFGLAGVSRLTAFLVMTPIVVVTVGLMLRAPTSRNRAYRCGAIRLGRPRRWRRLLRPGPLRPRVPGVHRAHADPVRRSPAAVPARTSRPRAGQLAAAGRLISYKSDSSRHANLGAPQSKGEPRGQGGHVQLGVGGRLRRGRE
jgi:hypothetical protein